MRRRDALMILAGAAVWPRALLAQQASARPLVAFQSGASPLIAQITSEALRAGLADAGFVEGTSVDLLMRPGGSDPAGAATVIAELVKLRPSVLVCSSNNAIRAALKAAPATPIVSGLLTDPVGNGFVRSLGLPGGNATGVTLTLEGLGAKIVDLALELFPQASTFGVLFNTNNPTVNDVQRRDLETAADAQDIKLLQVGVRGRSEIERAFQSFKRAGVSAVIVLSDPMLVDERREIANRALATRLATIFGGPRENVVDGGLINYNIDVQANWRLAGQQVGRILKGERPGNIPVEYPPKLAMAINRRTAVAIGAYIPPDVLQRAEDIVE